MCPLYMDSKTASEYSGLSEHEIKEMLRSIDPPPYMTVGNRRYIERDGLRKYLRRMQDAVEK